MKKTKAIIINVIIVIFLGAMAVAFFYGWNYYKDRYDSSKEEKEKIDEQVKSNFLSSLLVAEVFDSEKEKSWGDIFFLDSAGESIFPIETAHKISFMAEPQATKNNLFYYEPGEKKENLDHMILWAADFKGAAENKIASFTKDYYPMGLWMSPDEEKVVYMRAYKDNEAYSYWIFHNENGVSRELVPPSAKYHPVPYQKFSTDSESFNFLEKIDEEEYRLNEVRLEGSLVSYSFPAVTWNRIDWHDMWEVRPFNISANGQKFIYLDRKQNDKYIESTDIVVVDKKGQFTNLTNMPGNIYELAWSHNGEYIAYNRAEYDERGIRQEPQLWVMAKNGDNPEKIYQASDAGAIIADIYWDFNNNAIFFAERFPGKYSEIKAVDITNKEVRTLFSKEDIDKEKSYYRILQYLDIPKSLGWKTLEISKATNNVTEDSNISREKLLKYIENSINVLSPIKPAESSAWKAYKIGLASDSDLYVEYSDDHTAKKLLLHCAKNNNDIKCEETAFFEARLSDWELVEGEDRQKDKIVTYYEYRDGEWEESYKSNEKFVAPYNLEDIRDLQKKVDGGEEQWRLDPVQVVMKEIPKNYGFDPTSDRYILLIAEDGEARVEVVKGEKSYEVKLFQLTKKDEGGIWTIVRIKEI